MTNIINELTYACYAYNRQQAPHIAPERWQTVFGEQATTFECQYQIEQGNVLSLSAWPAGNEYHAIVQVNGDVREVEITRQQYFQLLLGETP